MLLLLVVEAFDFQQTHTRTIFDIARENAVTAAVAHASACVR